VTPQVRVVRTGCNGEPNLDRSIPRILDQTFIDLEFIDLELILVDDGSSDGTLAELRNTLRVHLLDRPGPMPARRSA
jgi:glycosyltransferase involved in cell wall biosynthesis